jgi:hypothetical protein
MDARWKQYKDTEYLISTDGDVWSNKTNRILKGIDDGNGYLAVSIDGVKIKVHRLVAITFIPNRDIEALTVNHIDGNKLNNSVANLEWLSQSNNIKHAWKSQLCKSGDLCTSSILSESDVIEIKKLFVEYTLNNTEIGQLFGVAKGTISKIRSLHTWREVSPELIFNANSPDKTNAKKLTGDDIPKIRQKYREGLSLADIGRLFNVHSGTISGIISGKTWKNY